VAKSKSGAGIKSKNVVRKPVRTGAGANRQLSAGVAQLGQRQGNHVTHQGATRYGGLEINAGPMGGVGAVPLGNEVALNVKGGGPGKGYVQHGQAGSQGCHGTPHKGNKTPTAKPLWEGWEK
jgi:hypothetical protein